MNGTDLLLMLPSDSFMPCFYYVTRGFQAFQLNILAVFDAVDKPLAFCILVDFLEIKFEVIVGF